jgi:hypothetical protein
MTAECPETQLCGWTCLSFNVNEPDYSHPSFDSTQVRHLGIQIHGEGDILLYVDDVGY